MQPQIITALLTLSGTMTGVVGTLVATAYQARVAQKGRAMELASGQQQAATRLHAEHISTRLEQRRTTYLDFMNAVSKLTHLTREDQLDAASSDYEAELEAAARAIEVARDPVILDGPQAVADVAAELCRIPYRLGGAALEVLEHSDGSAERLAAFEAMTEIRDHLLRHYALFCRAGSLAINLDGVGNYADELPWTLDAGGELAR
ncbi:hypothetical protein ACFZC3_15395 [Streptomyces sp. NPDC007903]|uniref:hypothetical protein n=1 Tax=Streptomyces sp. NPDC007903 TaxID=3364786 RepID=UPI0036EA0682